MELMQLTGDLAHLASILILIHRIHIRKTCAGISLKTHILYLTVFIARYGDLFLYTVSIYNTCMKILYLTTSSYIVFLMTLSPHYKSTWYRGLDTFTITPIFALSAVLALIITHRYEVFEVLWTFSIILESMAILPQLYHLTQVPSLPAVPLSHLVALGIYRFFYVLHWLGAIGRHSRRFDATSFFFGLLQTLIWADFLWVWYYRKVIKLVSDEPGDLEASGGAAEAASVDQGDLSRSFVLFHIFTMARAFEERFAVGRRGVGAANGLSVSAYPDDEVRIQREGTAATTFSDTAHPLTATEHADADGFSVASEDDEERRLAAHQLSLETALHTAAAPKST